MNASAVANVKLMKADDIYSLYCEEYVPVRHCCSIQMVPLNLYWHCKDMIDAAIKLFIELRCDSLGWCAANA